MDMEKTRMSALKWWISLAIVLCIALPAGLAFAQAAGLAAVGAPDPAHGFPKWYIDNNGLQLAPCLDNNAADPCGLVAAGALPNPAAPVVFPTNFPNEVFYNRATARIDGIGGGAFRADLGIALEGAFGGATTTVADGAAAEIVFARRRPGVNTVQTNLFNVTGKIFVRGSTTTSLTSSPNPSTVGQAVTLTATVRPVAPATGVPTGTVAFKDGAVTIGTATLGATGSASIAISTLATGSHPLTAVYSGSLDFLTSTSAVVTQTVNAVAPPPPPPAAAADSVTINLAQLVVGTGELRVEGVNGRIPAGGFAANDEIHNGAAVAGACPGALIGTASVNAADGTWRFRGTTTLAPTTVCVKSAGGGVSSRAVTQK